MGDPAVRVPLLPAEGGDPVRSALAGQVPATPIGRSDGTGTGGGGSFGGNVGGRDDSPIRSSSGGPDGEPDGEAGPEALLEQIDRTETRFHERPNEAFALRGAAGAPPLVQRNDPQRLRWRLSRLGVPGTTIDALLGGGAMFAVLGTEDDRNDGDDAAAATATRIGLERILGRNDLVDAPRFLEAGARAARSIGRIDAPNSQRRGWRSSGTGFLISPRLLLTNHHVLGTAAAAAGSTVEFDAHGPPADDVDPPVPARFRLTPDEFFLADKYLDYALVAVAATGSGGTDLTRFGWLPTVRGDEPILIDERVNIVHHPGGRLKQVSLRDNRVTDILDNFLHYRADTGTGIVGGTGLQRSVATRRPPSQRRPPPG